MTYPDLEDKVVLITGGAAGIGAGAARAFLGEGARVAIVDISEEALGKAEAELAAPDGHLITIVADVSNEDDVKRYVDTTLGAFGTIDVFFNNAGIPGRVAPVVDLDTAVFDRVLAINVRGAFLGLKHVLPVMYAKRSGSVINTSSIAGLASGIGLGATAYVSSKFAITGMTRLVAMESAAHHVRVNSVHPGMTNTALFHSTAVMMTDEGGDVDATRRAMESSIPLGRFGETADVANMVLFLASDASSFVTGSQFRVDGGQLT
ncbi:SDR family NAD(P)-dependent oxidoreductase [Pseudonocardia acaciae]|uniref:SDR family NAD(P)-dependent oxidoreductase n=1 Tax=Pseudonocardia acaciae TaxID=551276 RepID=UPI0004911995|nr:SDR family NAD(P)-dependent oxidoreductase [Pseudonocardia acaciae]